MNTDLAQVDAKTATQIRRRRYKQERAARRLPGRNDLYTAFSLDDLRDGLARLRREEILAQYWQRLIALRLEGQTPPGDYRAVWATVGSAWRRLDDLPGPASSPRPPFPDFAELWARPLDPTDVAAVLEHRRELHEAAAALSCFHADVKIRADLIFTEVLVRYQEEPTLALLSLAAQGAAVSGQVR